MEDLKNAFGEPTSYKGVLLYPIQMKYSDRFFEYVTSLLIEKNKIPDVRVIKMSYLRFLFEISNASNGESLYWRYLTKVLILVFRHKFKFLSDGKHLFIKVGKRLLTEKDFEEIRKIICRQNLIILNEDLLSPEVEKAINEAREFLSKKEQPPTTEENILSFFAATGYEPEKIKDLTIYVFNKTMQRLDLLKSWEVYSYPMLKSGDGEKLQHWLAHIPEKGLYDDVTITEDDFNKKTSNDMYKK